MVLQNAARGVFSRPIRGPERFEDSSNTPWNEPTTFHPKRIAEVPRRFLLSLCALPALQYHLFRNGEALMYNDSKDRSSQALPNFNELSVSMTLGLAVGSTNFRRLFSAC